MFQLPQGFDVKDLRSTLQLLEESDFHFYLTGSRRFRDHHESSDYDFFVQDEVAVREWLEENGFKRIAGHESYVLMLDCLVYRKGNVDVQVRNNVDEFERMNQWLDVHPEFYREMKPTRAYEDKFKTYRLLWRMVKYAVR